MSKNLRYDSSKWLFWGRWKDVPLYASPWHEAMHAQVYKRLKVKLQGDVKVLDGTFYFLKSDIDKVCAIMEKGGVKWFKNFFKLCEHQTSQLQKFHGSLEQCIVITIELLACSMMVEFADYYLTKKVQALSRKHDIDFSKVLAAMQPKRKTLLMQYHDETRKVKQSDIPAFLKRWQWVGFHAFEGRTITVKSIKELRREKFSSAKAPAKSAFPAELDKWVEIGSNLAFYRSNITEHFDMVTYRYKKEISLIGRKNGLTYTDMVSMTHYELLQYIKYEKIPVDLRQRKKSFGFIGIGNNVEILVGRRLAEEIKIHASGVTVQQSEIKGMVAQLGKAQGTVKVILTPTDCQKVKQGDVLVATETQPSYILAMQKAIAFVTDHGGITCHAAIIAREMKKPCVIGTQIATKVFKDGDRVEVDAVKGIVRKL